MPFHRSWLPVPVERALVGQQELELPPVQLVRHQSRKTNVQGAVAHSFTIIPSSVSCAISIRKHCSSLAPTARTQTPSRQTAPPQITQLHGFRSSGVTSRSHTSSLRNSGSRLTRVIANGGRASKA